MTERRVRAGLRAFRSASGLAVAAQSCRPVSSLVLRSSGLEVFDAKHLRVTLMEAGPRILPAPPDGLAKAAHEELEALGVRALVGASVTSNAYRDGDKFWRRGTRGHQRLGRGRTRT
jgi:hypothetical protein